MREIKFRAWDRDNNKPMFDPFETGLRFATILHAPSVEIMQFTGLHDKNGKEIYNDDLMKSNKGIVFKVFWSDRRNGWAVITRNAFRNLKNNKEFNYKSIEWAINNCEVIGNIHENPELL